MAGIVNEQGQLIVTGSGGGGGNVTVTGPLGSRVAAQSVSVALASDQIPLPITESDIEIPATVFTTGVGGPLIVNTPGPGTAVFFVHTSGGPTGNIGVQEKFTSIGAFQPCNFYIVSEPTLNNSVQNFLRSTSAISANAGTDFIIIVETHGVAVQLVNNLSAGQWNIQGTFKRNLFAIQPSVIVGNQGGFGAEVSTRNELATSLIAGQGPSDQQWTNMPSADGINPSPGGRNTPTFTVAPYYFNGATLDRVRGDLTNGAWVNIKNSVPLSTKQSISATATGTLAGTGQTIAIDSSGASTVVVTCPSTSGGLIATVAFEGTTDGVNWQQIPAKVLTGYNGAASGSMIKTFDPNQVIANQSVFIIPCGGFAQVRLNCTFLFAGSITFFLSATQDADLHDNLVHITPGDIAGNNLFTTLADNFGNQINIKPAFQAATNSDTALVVALSPNTVAPLATNAAKETGGNLETIANLNKFLNRVVQLTQEQNALLRGIYLQLGSMTGVTMNIEELTETSIQ